MRWLSLHVGGQRWAVHVVSRKSKFLKSEIDGSQLNGCTFYEKCAIYLANDLGESALEDTLLHELLHATFFVSGSQHTLEQVCKADKAYATEEQLILSLTPVMHRLLADLGFRFPRRV